MPNETWSAVYARHNDHRYFAPVDLERKETRIRRVLYVGSCFAEGIAHTIKSIGGADYDYILYNSAGELPEEPPRPLDNYDFQIVVPILRYMLPEGFFNRLSYTDEAGFKRFFDESCDRLRQLIEGALSYNRKSGIPVFFMNYLVPQKAPIGRLINPNSYSNPRYFIQRLNEVFCEEVYKHKNCYLFDIDGIANSIGKKFIHDDSIALHNHGTYLNDWGHEYDQTRIEVPHRVSESYEIHTEQFFRSVWHEIRAAFTTLQPTDPVKLVVIDLDDTLWRGIVGENALSPVPAEGWPIGFAEALLYLKHRGILLAIISKNDDSRVEKAWPDIYNIIRLEDFATRRINWRPKVENMAEILNEVNLLPKNVVYIDDNPVERESIKSAYPDIRVLGDQPYYLKRILLWSPETQVQSITAESSRRTEMVQSQVMRENDRKALTRPEFLASLQLKANFFQLNGTDDHRFTRVFELINKTNQFNTTGRRWKLEEVTNALSKGAKLYAIAVSDRYTDYGIVGAAIVIGNRIEQIVMSCRVVGMDVELMILTSLESEIATSGADQINATFIETEANLLCRSLFPNNGYQQGDSSWSKSVQLRTSRPEHILVA